MKTWATVIGYQLVWFAAVIGAGRGLAWPGLLAAATFIAAQLAIDRRRRRAVLLVLLGVSLGCLVDGGIAALGGLRYAAATWAVPAGGAPLWILGLWACFALAMQRSMSFICERPSLAIALGVIGGPLSYLAAERGWHAVQFVEPRWQPIAWLAIGWALAMAVLAWAVRRLFPGLAASNNMEKPA